MAEKLMDWIEKYRVPINNIVHVGAHFVQERKDYRKLNATYVLWVEALPWVADHAKLILADFPNQELVNALLWEKSGEERTFYVAGNEGSSSSTLKPFLISASHPEVVVSKSIILKTETLENLIARNKKILGSGNLLVMDTQGAELGILNGAGTSLDLFDYIIAEVSTKELYESTAEFRDFNRKMSDLSFSLVEAEINRVTGWGDALYMRSNLRKELIPEPTINFVGRRFGVRTFIRTQKMKLNRLK